MPGFSGSLSQAEIDAVSVYSVGLQSGTGATTTTEATTTTTQAGVAIDPLTGEGATTYAANCAACHGAAGEGGLGPSLQTSLFDLDATVDAIANGVGVMPGFSDGLSGDQITEVAMYSVSFQSGPGAANDSGSIDGEPTGDLPGEGAGTPSGDDRIVAIQPSRYVELDTDRNSVPLAQGVELGLALASMGLLGLLAYWQVRRTRRADAGSGGTTVDSADSENL